MVQITTANKARVTRTLSRLIHCLYSWFASASLAVADHAAPKRRGFVSQHMQKPQVTAHQAAHQDQGAYIDDQSQGDENPW